MSEQIEFGKNLEVTQTNIPGLIVVDLPVHGDSRGWFKENWQREKMTSLGLPDFKPVQNNISYNAEKGVTRGIHAEPWDKYVSVGAGKIFGAWVDLREGESFGQVFTAEIDPTKAVYVPRGVGNAFQALEDNTVYTYLVTDHWAEDSVPLYTFLNLADSTSAIDWPISLDQAQLSEKDKSHPELGNVTPMAAKKIMVLGSNGQLGKALQKVFPNAEFVDKEELDITKEESYKGRNWRQYEAIINAAAYTAVDAAETTEGRKTCWEVNATAVQYMARLAIENDLKLIHVSSDYVFDGQTTPHTESEPFSPLGVYGQAKAAGDIAAASAPKHYIARTSWVVGEGNNFVKTMRSLAEKDIKPSVVNDQIGRLTFANTLAEGIKHLLNSEAPYGTYNLTNDGDLASWSDIAKIVFASSGKPSDDVTGLSTAEYYAGKQDIAPRPLNSALDLSKIKAAGYNPADWKTELQNYLASL